MAIVELPLVGGNSNYRVNVVMDDSEFIVAMFWNERASVWLMSLYELDLTPIAFSIPVVLGAYLGSIYTHDLFSDGVFVAVDNGPSERDAGFFDLGTRVVVKYIPVNDLLAKIAGVA